MDWYSVVSNMANPIPLASDVLERLRAASPHLFEAPTFWVSGLEAIEARLAEVRRGERRVLGQSAGGREISAVAYGPFEPQSPTATISSAMASDRPQVFFDPARRTRPVLVLIGSIHGGETEGIALCMNLIHLLETGVDLRGQRQERLLSLLEKVRLVVVPCLNPDGRAAAGVAHLCGATVDELYLVQQGLLADGTPFKGRKIKEVQPIPPGYLRHMGGYYNAAGVNLQHDDFFGPRLAPENDAVRSLFRRELPDAFLTFHAHGGRPAFLTPDAYLSPGCQRKQTEAAGYALSRLGAQGIPFAPPDTIVPPPWSFFFQTWLHHMSGALPLLFEFCHGLSGYAPSSLEETLQTGLLTTEAWVEYCLLFGARPRASELFSAVTPA